MRSTVEACQSNTGGSMQDDPARKQFSLFNILLGMSIVCVLLAVSDYIWFGLVGYENPVVSLGLLGTTAGAIVGALRFGIRGAFLAGAICGTLTCILGLIISFAIALCFAFSSGGEQWWF
jgi:hypothetical protein